MRRLLYLVALALLCSNPSAFAQQGTTEVRGVVTDAQGAVLPGVTVEVRNQDTGMYRSTVSNSDGTYFVSGIGPGRYQITASLEGFKTFQQKDLLLSLGKTSTVAVRLEVAEFAVHLDQVRDGRARMDYQDPSRFFERTYLTYSLISFSAEVLRRLSGITTETSAVF